MENFEHLSQEELLEAAQKAYDEQADSCVPYKAPSPEEEVGLEEQPEVSSTEEPIEPEEPALGDELSPDELAESFPPAISTNGTAIGIAAGLVLGAGIGFITGQVAPCLTIGVLLGVLVGLLFDVKKDKKAAIPKEEEATPLSTILDDTIQEDECNE